MTTADELDKIDEKPPITHYLLSVTGQGEPVKGDILAVQIGKALSLCGIEAIWAMSYVSPLAVDPRDVGLRNAWSGLDDQSRNLLRVLHPELAAAIDLVCGP